MADLDLAGLRRLAEAARERELPWAPPFTIEESLYLSAVPPAVVLQLLDRLEAAEARVEPTYPLTADGEPVVEWLERQAAKHREEGWDTLAHNFAVAALAVRRALCAGCGIVPCEDGRCACPALAVPGAVAGEPESTPAADRLQAHAERLAADPQIEATCAEIDRRLAAGEPLDDLLGPGVTVEEFRRQYLDAPESTPAAEPYVAAKGPQCGDPYHRHTGSCFLYDTQRHPRAADTQEAP